MKNKFSPRRNALLTPGGVSVGVVVVLIAGVVVLVRVLFPGVLFAALAPVLRGGSSITASVGAFRASFGDTAALVRERDALKEENASLARENANLSARLSDLTKTLSGDAKGIAAGVLAAPPITSYDILLVGAGSDDGVAVGMHAYANGTPVGVVEAVTSGNARITLYSAPGQELHGWVGSAREALTLVGEGGGAFSATIAKEAKVAEGDLVYAPGPGALVVGTVAKVSSDASSPSATLAISPVVNPFTLTWVLLTP